MAQARAGEDVAFGAAVDPAGGNHVSEGGAESDMADATKLAQGGDREGGSSVCEVIFALLLEAGGRRGGLDERRGQIVDRGPRAPRPAQPRSPTHEAAREAGLSWSAGCREAQRLGAGHKQEDG